MFLPQIVFNVNLEINCCKCVPSDRFISVARIDLIKSEVCSLYHGKKITEFDELKLHSAPY